MILAQMYALANGKSGYSRSDGEIYSALNRAGQRVFNAVLKEFSGFFLKFDETSLILAPVAVGADQEYALPADLTQLVHLAERVTSSEDWHPMHPEGLDAALTDLRSAVRWSDFQYGGSSAFSFYGPYLDSTATLAGSALQIQKIRVSPAIETTRMCQIVYTAKWLPITGSSSPVMLPDEGTPCMEAWASAELCEMNDDTRADRYEKRGLRDMSGFLSWLRSRQIMNPPTIDAYGPGE